MKRPILYRILFYSLMIVPWGFVFYLLSLMTEAPFTSKDMGYAFFHGCNIGLHAPITDESITRCLSISEDFKEGLDDLDRQMNAY